jgi:TonB family protein
MTAEQKARFEERMRKRAAEVCSEGAAGRDATRIGGNLRVPVKLRDVRPVYPADLASTGVSGTVVLLALIGTGGSVQDVTVESASHREFADAAMDAVRQWEFDATLLNCVPVETRMIVTANFVQR